jgi:NAD-dependent dihydropyrimidine dehydrogenase PreA subunit
MKWLFYIFVNIVETLLRVFPLPAKTGLVKIGSPGSNSPVFLTCNYHLTVQRVKRALRSMDAYLLVANSRGINVWCAAAGGHFTNHSVISVLKTSGIERLVDHKTVVLPQLAATGIEARDIQEKTGWKVIWGPVYAGDITRFIAEELKKTPEMRQVEFSWVQRIEMAVAWAFPISFVADLIVIPFWRQAIPNLTLLVWGLSFLIFLSFPLYSRWLHSDGKRIGLVFFDFGRGGFQLILWLAIIIGLVVYSFAAGYFAWGFILRWGFASLIVILMLSIDLAGSTPVYKSGLLEGSLFKITLDGEKCRGAGFCESVCPRDCYELDKRRNIATIPRAERCIQCGACIVQCPFDALHFESSQGGMIEPDDIRKFKLNMMGKRVLKV